MYKRRFSYFLFQVFHRLGHLCACACIDPRGSLAFHLPSPCPWASLVGERASLLTRCGAPCLAQQFTMVFIFDNGLWLEVDEDRPSLSEAELERLIRAAEQPPAPAPAVRPRSATPEPPPTPREGVMAHASPNEPNPLPLETAEVMSPASADEEVMQSARKPRQGSRASGPPLQPLLPSPPPPLPQPQLSLGTGSCRRRGSEASGASTKTSTRGARRDSQAVNATQLSPTGAVASRGSPQDYDSEAPRLWLAARSAFAAKSALRRQPPPPEKQRFPSYQTPASRRERATIGGRGGARRPSSPYNPILALPPHVLTPFVHEQEQRLRAKAGVSPPSLSPPPTATHTSAARNGTRINSGGVSISNSLHARRQQLSRATTFGAVASVRAASAPQGGRFAARQRIGMPQPSSAMAPVRFGEYPMMSLTGDDRKAYARTIAIGAAAQFEWPSKQEQIIASDPSFSPSKVSHNDDESLVRGRTHERRMRNRSTIARHEASARWRQLPSEPPVYSEHYTEHYANARHEAAHAAMRSRADVTGGEEGAGEDNALVTIEATSEDPMSNARTADGSDGHGVEFHAGSTPAPLNSPRGFGNAPSPHTSPMTSLVGQDSAAELMFEPEGESKEQGAEDDELIEAAAEAEAEEAEQEADVQHQADAARARAWEVQNAGRPRDLLRASTPQPMRQGCSALGGPSVGGTHGRPATAGPYASAGILGRVPRVLGAASQGANGGVSVVRVVPSGRDLLLAAHKVSRPSSPYVLGSASTFYSYASGAPSGGQSRGRAAARPATASAALRRAGSLSTLDLVASTHAVKGLSHGLSRPVSGYRRHI